MLLLKRVWRLAGVMAIVSLVVGCGGEAFDEINEGYAQDHLIATLFVSCGAADGESEPLGSQRQLERPLNPGEQVKIVDEGPCRGPVDAQGNETNLRKVEFIEDGTVAWIVAEAIATGGTAKVAQRPAPTPAPTPSTCPSSVVRAMQEVAAFIGHKDLPGGYHLEFDGSSGITMPSSIESKMGGELFARGATLEFWIRPDAGFGESWFNPRGTVIRAGTRYINKLDPFDYWASPATSPADPQSVDRHEGWLVQTAAYYNQQGVVSDRGWIEFVHGFGSSAADGAVWRTPDYLLKDIWQHVAITYDSSSPDNDPAIYINGRDVPVIEVVSPSGSSTAGSAPVEIGQSELANYLGAINEIRVWKGIRKEFGIKAIMYDELSGEEDGLLLYLKFNEGSGELTTDSTGNLWQVVSLDPGRAPTWGQTGP